MSDPQDDQTEVPLAQALRPRGPVQFAIGHYRRPEASVITVAGELDLLTAPRFSAFVSQLIRGSAGDLLVDLSEVRFVDSAGLHVLLSAERRVSRSARWLALICPPGPARRVIELARLAEALRVRSSFSDYESDREAREGDQAAPAA